MKHPVALYVLQFVGCVWLANFALIGAEEVRSKFYVFATITTLLWSVFEFATHIFLIAGPK